jgi:hypothetical protein
VPQDDRAFLSYSRDDKDFVRRLASDLKAAGANVWLDQLDIVPGDLWDRSIEDALNECPRMLVILSPASVNSRNVMDEVSFALETNKRLIPVVYRECKVPFRLSRIQQVDFRNDYGLALQALLLAIAPIKDPNQSNPSIGAPASETPEQRQLEKRPRKGPQGQKKRKDPEGALVENKPEFSLPWTSEDHASATLRNPAVLLTDNKLITSSDLSWFVQDCKDTGRPPVFVAPSIDPSVAQLMKSLGGLAIRATDLTEQPVSELLGDVGMHLGGNALLKEYGFGLATREDNEEEISRGVLCSFPQMAKNDLCRARSVSTDGYSTRFEARYPGPDVDFGLKYLKHRASHYARSDAEFEGLNARLRRFGIDATASRRPIERVTFERSLEEVLLPAGFASSYFVTDADHYSCKIERPKILVTTFPIETRDQIIPALQQAVAQAGGGLVVFPPLVVFAPAIHQDALATMVVNKLRGIVLCLAVQTADAKQLLAVAQLTGAGLIDEAHAKVLLRDSVGAHFGEAREVVAEIGKTKVKK